MKALMKVALGPEGVMIQDTAEPQPKPNEVKIKVHAAGICGTDLHILHDEWKVNMPVVMGHEYSGVVAEVGSEVTGFRPGDRVVSLASMETCGRCRHCYEGVLHVCDQRLSLGSGVNGVFAEYTVIPEHLVLKLPDDITLDEAALCEPLACCVRAVLERGSVKAGDYVLISGPGPIGQLCMQLAIASGGRVVVTGTSADRDRLRLAAEMGAMKTIVVDEEDTAEVVKEVTRGAGFDVAFECAGVAASLDSCLHLLRKRSLFVQMALFGTLFGRTIEFNPDLFMTKEILVTYSFASARSSWPLAFRLLQNKQVNVLALTSGKFPLDDWEKAFHMVINKEGYKVLLDPCAD
jgi:L-iditol 2-dehydrogenase